MPGVFGTSTLPMAMGKVNRALYNQAAGTFPNITLRARLGAYYGLGGSIALYASFNGRAYPFDYL
jgi:hypothetical protein